MVQNWIENKRDKWLALLRACEHVAAMLKRNTSVDYTWRFSIRNIAKLCKSCYVFTDCFVLVLVVTVHFSAGFPWGDDTNYRHNGATCWVEKHRRKCCWQAEKAVMFLSIYWLQGPLWGLWGGFSLGLNYLKEQGLGFGAPGEREVR